MGWRVVSGVLCASPKRCISERSRCGRLDVLATCARWVSSLRKARVVVKSFTIAAFALDGEQVGLAECEFDKLSSNWIDVCSGLSRHYGPVFDTPLQGNLNHVRIKCTSVDGAALVVIYMDNIPASSGAIACGISPAAEMEMLKLFASSVRASTEPYHREATAPFSDIERLEDRPLLVVVPWPSDAISDQDREIAKELMWHFAAAFALHASQRH